MVAFDGLKDFPELEGSLDANVILGVQGPQGPIGPQGPAGDNYVLTDADKAEIAELAADLVEAPEHSGGNVELDTTLTQSGKAADAKAVGEKIGEISQHKADKAGWTANKFIGTDAEGNLVEKDDPGTPTEEQVSSAVSNWLDEHPEATTTVQDGSITEEKLSDDLQSKLRFGGSIFEGKTASFYGDSLTEQNYHYSKGYHSWIQDILGLASYNNYGLSGRTLAQVTQIIEETDDGNPDVVFVMAGVNDQMASVPLGTMGDTGYDTTYGAAYNLCRVLNEKYPRKIKVVITPHYQTRYPHKNGVITSYQVSRAIIEVCTKYSVPYYDNYVLSGINAQNLYYWTTDDCHWNNIAHQMVGKNIAKWLADTFQFEWTGSPYLLTSVDKLTLEKGESAEFIVKLDADPKGGYTVVINATNQNVTVSPANMSLNSNTWNSDNVVTVTAIDDGTTNEFTSVVNVAHAGVRTKQIAVTVLGDGNTGGDTGGGDTEVVYGNIVLSKASSDIDADGSDVFTVKLDKAPTNNQTVLLSCADNSVELSASSLTFTPENYNVAQSVTVSKNGGTNGDTFTVTVTSSNVSNATVVYSVIKEEAPETFVGKTFTITGTNGGNKYFFEAVIAIPAPDSTISQKFSYEPANGVDFSSVSTASTFFANNMESDGIYTGYFGSTTACTIADGVVTIPDRPNVGNPSAASQYAKVGLVLGWYGDVFPSFKINELEISVNGSVVPILAIGGFYAKETFTLT